MLAVLAYFKGFFSWGLEKVNKNMKFNKTRLVRLARAQCLFNGRDLP